MIKILLLYKVKMKKYFRVFLLLITSVQVHAQRIDTIIGKIQQYQFKKLQQFARAYKKPDKLKDGIQTATLKEVGIDEKIIKMMEDSITAGNYPNIHSVLILRNNKLVYENYFL